MGELAKGDFRDPLPRLILGVDLGVVMDHQRPVSCRVNVELDGVRPQLDRAQKRRDRILGKSLMRPAVGDLLGGLSARWPQVSLWVVAFGT